MSVYELLGIAVGLAMDAVAVAIAASISLGAVTGRQLFRFAFHFGLFQALMPVVGWLAGKGLRGYIEAWDHWAAFALLAAIGGKAVLDAVSGRDSQEDMGDPTRGLTLVALSVATSIDALAVGFSLALLGLDPWYPAVVIGGVTAGLTTAAMVVGTRVGGRLGVRARVVGGLVLIAIGVKILWTHTQG